MKSKNSKIVDGSIKAGTSLENRTGNWKIFKPEVDFKRCIHCMSCVNYCPDICIPVKNEKRQETNLEFCKGCSICVEVCLVKCIKMVKDD